MLQSFLLPAPAASDASSCDETNLSRPHLGEASESHKHLSHPSPSREWGGQSCSPKPPKQHFQPAHWHFGALFTGFFRAVVSRLSATTFTVEGSWQGGQQGMLTLSLALGTAPGHTAAWKGPFPLIPGDSRVTSQHL